VNKSILLIGGGGHCHSVIDSIISCEQYDNIGVVARDDMNLRNLRNDELVADILVGTDAELPELFAAGWHEAFISLGSVGNTTGRTNIYSLLKKIGFILPAIIDKSAVVSSAATIGEGTFVGKKAVVNSGSKVGKCAIINTGSIVEHDCRIGDFSHISPGVTICGQVNVGNHSHVGAGSVVIQTINIGNNVLVGAGSVVVDDIVSNVKAFGNPCKVVG